MCLKESNPKSLEGSTAGKRVERAAWGFLDFGHVRNLLSVYYACDIAVREIMNRPLIKQRMRGASLI